ncbi:MAG TPA: tetratricopeptide repeat protein [Gammaproteobacteria bacterium]|nr:tetratricopeptide repeat protein [Gammaproteobacteria bacterium]
MKAHRTQLRPVKLLVRCAGLLLLCFAAPGAAQEAAETDVRRSEPGLMMSEHAYRRFEQITALYGDGRHADALAMAESYLRADLNDYERAMGEQLAGYALVALGRPTEALPRFERAVALDALPNDAHFNMLRSLAQLYASLERWQQSVDVMSRYFVYQQDASAEDRIMMGQALVQLGRHREALSWVRGALERAGDEPRESWLQLELAILFELDDHAGALDVLNRMVARWPDRLRYWEMMAGVHQQLNQDMEALAALTAAYNGGLFTGQEKLLNLVRMNMYVGLPYQAGRILDRALDASRVEADRATLELLLEAWVAAREFDLAAGVIDRLAPLSRDGNLYMRKARMRMEQNQWQAALEAVDRALELGGVSEPGNAWLLRGIALLELERLEESRQAFRQAQDFDPDTRRQAREWQRFVEDKIRVAGLRPGR